MQNTLIALDVTTIVKTEAIRTYMSIHNYRNFLVLFHVPFGMLL